LAQELRCARRRLFPDRAGRLPADEGKQKWINRLHRIEKRRRCLALEGAPAGIRVNVVNPDAVIKGSKIWDGAWRQERAGAYGIDAGEELEAHYRNRSMLKQDVLPKDVAEAVYFFASDFSAKSTGNMINVDAGNPQAFVR
jgi:NAD(P)-dependent dehydrogenase (short-subunit alcohol dehydrogenase family)